MADLIIADIEFKGRSLKPKPHKRMPRVGWQFLKGPIDLQWLQLAASLPGKSLHVGLVLWYLAGLKKQKTFKLSRTTLESFSINRHAAYRALKALEHAGLVSVERHPGRLPIVTLRDVPMRT